MAHLNTILYCLYLLVGQLKASRLCMYQCDNGNYTHYCSGYLEFCDEERDFCPLYGYQNLYNVNFCEPYYNQQYSYSLWCSYKCNETHKSNFCISSGQVCPLQSPQEHCPMFYIPLWYNNISQCENHKNNTLQLFEEISWETKSTENDIVAGFQITLNSLNISSNNEMATITFYVNYTTYQCSISLLASKRNYYCNTLNFATTQCDTDKIKINIPSYGMQIDFSNAQIDNIEIESVFIISKKITLSMEYFCSDYNICSNITNDAVDMIVINESNPSILLTFDINAINQDAKVLNVAVYTLNNAISTPYCVEVSPIMFGFRTGDSWQSGSENKIISILRWGKLMYQCFKYAQNKNELYLCDTRSSAESCHTSLNDSVYGLEIHNEESDALGIGSVIINIVNRNLSYEIDVFCFSTNHTALLTKTQNAYFNNVSCSNNIGYDIVFLHVEYFTYWWINLTPKHISHEAMVDIMDEPLMCSPLTPNKYILVEQPTNWTDAQSYCHKIHNSSLASIVTDKDFDIAMILKHEKYEYTVTNAWIGLNDLSGEGLWSWIDGTSCGYTEDGLCENDGHWLPGEPNDEFNEDCAVLYDLYGFNDENCQRQYIFFCNNNDYTMLQFETTKDNIEEDIATTGNKENVLIKNTTNIFIGIIICIMFGCILISIGFTVCHKSNQQINKQQQHQIVELKDDVVSLQLEVVTLKNEFSSITGYSHDHQTDSGHANNQIKEDIGDCKDESVEGATDTTNLN